MTIKFYPRISGVKLSIKNNYIAFYVTPKIELPKT